MKAEQKNQIKAKLQEYCAKYGSQNKAANSLKGVSAGTISQVLNENWEHITDEMWLKISKQIGITSKELVIIQTQNFKFLTKMFEDARTNSSVMSLIDAPGASKTKTAEVYAKNQNVYLLQCNEYWNRKMFLYELASAIGEKPSGLNVNEMVLLIVSTLKVKDSPLIILDEFDKVSDQVLYFFITLYNQLQDECGIVTLSTDHLEKRVRKGLRLNRKGYQEFYSRIGRKFMKMPGVKSTDIDAICRANGVTTAGDIKSVIEDCENDLRRVKRKIHAIKNAA
jgi:plasmid maintenance system antidote protein VapI